MRLKSNLNFDGDIDWTAEEITRDAKIKSIWYQAANAISPEDKAGVDADLGRASSTLSALAYILARKYKETATKEVDFTTPNYHETLIYAKGYEQALKDVYNVIPQKAISKPDQGD
jgi:hypothetical protein